MSSKSLRCGNDETCNRPDAAILQITASAFVHGQRNGVQIMDHENTAAGGSITPATARHPMKLCVLAHTKMGVTVEEFDTEEERLAWLKLQSDVIDDFYFMDIEGKIKNYGIPPVGDAAAEELENLCR